MSPPPPLVSATDLDSALGTTSATGQKPPNGMGGGQSLGTQTRTQTTTTTTIAPTTTPSKENAARIILGPIFNGSGPGREARGARE